MFSSNAFGWGFFADGAVTLGAALALRSGGAGGAWVPRYRPKLMTADDVRRLLGRETGILVKAEDDEEEVRVLQMLGLL